MKKNSQFLIISVKKVIRFGILLLFLLAISIPQNALAAGDAGWALWFDGIDDYVKLGRTDTILGSGWKGTKSFSLWVKPEGIATACPINDVASCEQILTDQPHFFGIARGIIEGQDRIWLWNYDGAYRRVPISYTAGEWIHISFVMAGGTLKGYRNGNLVGQVSTGDTFMDEDVNFTNLLIGAFIRADRVAAFQGLIDEVRIYNTELLSATIVATLKSPLEGNESGLRAYYQMSDGSGTALTDDSDNSFTGTLMNGFETVGNGPLWVSSTAWDYPVADDQLVTIDEDKPINITLTGSAAQSGSLVFYLVEGPEHGGLTGTIPDYSYHPDLNYNGTDKITFYVTEGTLQSSLASVTITVSPVNDLPVANSDEYILAMNETLAISAPGLLANDTDVDEDILQIGTLQYTGTGILNVIEDGAFFYTPPTGFYGVDQFSYTVSDGTVLGNTVLVNLTVNRTIFYIFLPTIEK